MLLVENTGGTIQEEGASLLGAVMLCFLFLLQLYCCQRPLGEDTLALASIKGQWHSCWWIPAKSCRHSSRQLPCLSPPPFWPGVSFPVAIPNHGFLPTGLGFKTVDQLWLRSTSLPSTSHQIPLLEMTPVTPLPHLSFLRYCLHNSLSSFIINNSFYEHSLLDLLCGFCLLIGHWYNPLTTMCLWTLVLLVLTPFLDHVHVESANSYKCGNMTLWNISRCFPPQIFFLSCDHPHSGHWMGVPCCFRGTELEDKGSPTFFVVNSRVLIQL